MEEDRGNTINGWTPRRERLTWSDGHIELEATVTTWADFQEAMVADGNRNGVEIPASLATDTMRSQASFEPDGSDAGIIIRGWVDGNICMTNFCLLGQHDNNAGEPLLAFALAISPQLFRANREEVESRRRNMKWQIEGDTAHCSLEQMMLTVQPDTPRGMRSSLESTEQRCSGNLPPGTQPEPGKQDDQPIFVVRITSSGIPRMVCSVNRLGSQEEQLETIEDFTRRVSPEELLRIYIQATGGPAT